MKATNEQNLKNKNHGITLIALIITIIVMLILVAVTVTMAVNGGLFEKAASVGRQTNEKRDQELEFAKGETIQDLINKYVVSTGVDLGKKPNPDCEICGGKTFYYNILCDGCGERNHLWADEFGEISQYGAMMYCEICSKETFCPSVDDRIGDIKCSECNYRIFETGLMNLEMSVTYARIVIVLLLALITGLGVKSVMHRSTIRLEIILIVCIADRKFTMSKVVLVFAQIVLNNAIGDVVQMQLGTRFKCMKIC